MAVLARRLRAAGVLVVAALLVGAPGGAYAQPSDEDASEDAPASAFELEAAALEHVSVENHVAAPPRPIATLSAVRSATAQGQRLHADAAMRTEAHAATLAAARSATRAEAKTQGTDRTMTKVVKMLQDMLVESKGDGEADDAMFAKFRCYCDSNTEQKEKSIKGLEESIGLLSGQIEEHQASNAKLSTESAEAEADLAENERARASALSLRKKSREDFISEEADMTNAMGQMNQAIDTLAAIGSDKAASTQVGLLAKKQVKDGASSGFSGDVKRALATASVFLSPAEKRSVSAFLQAPGEHYKSSSGEVIGILKSMRDTFKTNLANARAAEAASAEAHGKFMKVQLDAFAELELAHEEKANALSENDNALGTAREQKETAEASLASDQDFLAKLTAVCKSRSAEYADRKMMRANEEAAIAQAISILNSDDAFENFGKVDATSTGSTSFVQLRASKRRHTGLREELRRDLQNTATKAKSLRLAKIAVSLEDGNPFDMITGQIDDMIALIHKEEEADAEQHAWCASEREANYDQKADKESTITSINGAITGLVETLDSEVDGLHKQLANEEATLAQNRKDQAEELAERKDDNAAYQAQVKELDSAQKTVNKALAVLNKYYEWLHKKQGPHHYEKMEGKDSGGGNIKRVSEASVADLEEMCSAQPECAGFNSEGWMKSTVKPNGDLYDVGGTDLYVKVYDAENPVLLARGGSLARRHGRRLLEDPAPPQTWEGEGPNKGPGKTEQGGEVVSMLDFILSETAEEMKVLHETEIKAQHEFEDSKSELLSEEAATQERIADLEAQVATKIKELEEEKADLQKTTAEKEAIEEYLQKIRPGCDFIVKNIDERNTNRRLEIESLQSAIGRLEETPAFQEAAAEEERQALGECAEPCAEDREVLACKACLASSTEEAFCAANEQDPACEGFAPGAEAAAAA